MPDIQPYGTWESPITANELYRKIIGFSNVQIVDDTLYWLESNPENHKHQILYRQNNKLVKNKKIQFRTR